MPLLAIESEHVSQLVAQLALMGSPLGLVILAAAVAAAAVAVVPAWRRWTEPALWTLTGVLVVGEAVLAWFHWSLWQAAAIVDPVSGAVTSRVAVPLWVESEKLYVWALVVAVMTLCVRRHRAEMLPPLAAVTAVLAAAAILVGKPFTAPLPQFLTMWQQYVSAMASGVPQAAAGAFQGITGSATYYYNAWFMWVHPPLLFISYGAFVVSFVASSLMILRRTSSYEVVAYGWAKIGYLPLTLGMLLGFPWALLSWQGEAWWWSGKVNMSIMMWLLYTAYLHGRLYLRRRGMWKVVAALAVLSFIALLLTYITTYVVPGAHSVA
jgi:cytochrome c biogenesis factor